MGLLTERQLIEVDASPAVEIEIRRYRACDNEISAMRLEGYAIDQIAEKTGWSVRTVKRRLEDEGLTKERTDTEPTAVVFSDCVWASEVPE